MFVSNGAVRSLCPKVVLFSSLFKTQPFMMCWVVEDSHESKLGVCGGCWDMGKAPQFRRPTGHDDSEQMRLGSILFCRTVSESSVMCLIMCSMSITPCDVLSSYWMSVGQEVTFGIYKYSLCDILLVIFMVLLRSGKPSWSCWYYLQLKCYFVFCFCLFCLLPWSYNRLSLTLSRPFGLSDCHFFYMRSTISIIRLLNCFLFWRDLVIQLFVTVFCVFAFLLGWVAVNCI